MQAAHDRVFLDANVVFSAAYARSSDLRRLWSLPDTTLLTSTYVVAEVRRNIPAERYAEFQMLLRTVAIVPTPSVGEWPVPPALDLPDKDVPIFLAAAAANASHLLTGDKRHFGAYFGHRFAGVLILEPGTYLKSRR